MSNELTKHYSNVFEQLNILFLTKIILKLKASSELFVPWSRKKFLNLFTDIWLFVYFIKKKKKVKRLKINGLWLREC